MAGSKILIVEDETILARDMATRLERMGYDVAGTAECGEDAVRIALETRPELVLMDIKLDGEMDGILAAKQIRESMNSSIVYVTAHSDRDIFQIAKQTQPHAYLIKPVSFQELQRTLELVFAQRAVERSLQESEERYQKLYEQSKNQEEVYLSLLDGSADPIVIYDMEGRVTYLNPAHTQLFGWTLEEAKGQRLRTLPEHDQQATMMIIQEILQQGTARRAYDTQRLTKDGRSSMYR